MIFIGKFDARVLNSIIVSTKFDDSDCTIKITNHVCKCVVSCTKKISEIFSLVRGRSSKFYSKRVQTSTRFSEDIRFSFDFVGPIYFLACLTVCEFSCEPFDKKVLLRTI